MQTDRGNNGTVIAHWTDLYTQPKYYKPYVAPPFPPKNADGFLGANYWDVVLKIKEDKHREDLKVLAAATKDLRATERGRAVQDIIPYGPKPGLNKKYPYGYEGKKSYSLAWQPATVVKPGAAYDPTVYMAPSATQVAARKAITLAHRTRVEQIERDTAKRVLETNVTREASQVEWNREAVENAGNPLYLANHTNHANHTTVETRKVHFALPAYDDDGTQIDGVYQPKHRVGEAGVTARAEAAETARVREARDNQKKGLDLSWRSGV